MENFQYCLPTRYIFGQGVSSKVGQTISDLGYKKVLIVYGGGSAVRSGLISSIMEQLASFSIGYTLLGGVKPNPRADLVYEGIEIARKEKVDFILPVGGGSVIDTAKAISLGAADSEQGDFFDFYLKKRKPVSSLKVGAVLTIPAAGSESSSSSVIQKTIGGHIIKCGCSSELNRPSFAILDPELTYTVSKYQTACGITDMMAHIMERYFTNSECVDVTDNICEGLLRAIIKNAQTVMENPRNYDARANIMWAGSLAHNNICGVDREQDWSSHHLEHQLSALYDVIVSNNKKPIGVCAMVISDNTIIALSHDKAPDKALFETSLKEFLKNDKLNVTVTLYTEKDTFIKRAANMAANYDNSDTTKNNRMKYVTESCLNMCL